MSLSWHSITQLNPFSAEQETLGAQDLPDFSVEQIPLTAVSSMMGGLEGGGKQQDCLVTLSSGIHNTAVGVAINGLWLEFYKFPFINALQTTKTPLFLNIDLWLLKRLNNLVCFAQRQHS